MPDRFDPGADDLARDQARMIMERWTPFARMSRRLLADLLDRSVIVDLDDTADSTSARSQWTEGRDRKIDPLLGIVVLSGEVEVGPADSQETHSLGVGVHMRDQFRGRRKALRIRARYRTAAAAHDGAPDEDREPARVALLKASSVTPELAWSLQEQNLTSQAVGSIKRLNALCRPELILCDTNFTFREHLEPLTHLLAGTIARDLRETTAVVTLRADGTVEVVLMSPNPDDGSVQLLPASVPGLEKAPAPRFKKAAARGAQQESAPPEPVRYPPINKKQLCDIGLLKPVARAAKRAALARDKPPQLRVQSRPKNLNDKRSHVFVIDLDRSRQRSPVIAKDMTFDRIVYLTDRVPPAVPRFLRNQLDPWLFDVNDEAPYYCSFIPSILVAKDVNRRGRRGASFEARRVRFARRRQVEEPYRFLSRFDRDACVVPVDFAPLAKAWKSHRRSKRQAPFFTNDFKQGITAESVARWGRAVTNRRIGIAVSGGGACAYRVGPLLARLAHYHVPIDVFAGLSGGALVGAFFCHSGLEGFARVVAMGPFIQLTAPLALFTTRPLQAVVDYVLGGTRVEDLEVRFAAVAVALPPDDPPMTQVVVSGTIGEAVQVSGTLPPAFAETVKGGMRFTDGGAGTIVPAQVARDFGADIVLAVNAIPGPQRSNPLPAWLRAPLAIAAPWLQRPIDYLAWHAYLWRQASQRFLREADVAFEFEPETLSMLEAAQWSSSWDIVERARQLSPQIESVVWQLRSRWRTLGDRLPWWRMHRAKAAARK